MQLKQPCPKCLRTRQKFKDMMAALSGRNHSHTLVETTKFDIVIDNKTNNITSISEDDYRGYIGTKVYISRRVLVNMHTAMVMRELGTIVKASRVDLDASQV